MFVFVALAFYFQLSYVAIFLFSFKVVQASLCIFLGSALDINNEDQQTHASRANDVVLVLNMLIVGVNIVINAFDMKESSDSADAAATALLVNASQPITTK